MCFFIIYEFIFHSQVLVYELCYYDIDMIYRIRKYHVNLFSNKNMEFSIYRRILRWHAFYTINFLSASIGGTAIFITNPSRRGFPVTTFQYLVNKKNNNVVIITNVFNVQN